MILTKEQQEQVVEYYNAYYEWWTDDYEEVQHPSFYGNDKYLQAFDRLRTKSVVAETIQLAARHDKGVDKAFALLYTMGFEVQE